MLRFIQKLTLVCILMVFMVTTANAVTRDKVIEVSKMAAALVQADGVNAAIKAIGDPKGPFVWNDGVNYVFLMDMDGKMLAHPFNPELTKKGSLLGAKDAKGKSFFVDFVKAAEQGRGWTNYVWPLPGKKTPIRKYTYILRVPNTDYFVGSGLYVLKAGEYY